MPIAIVDFQTSLGTIPLTGSEFDVDKPAVLAITGAFAKADDLCRLPLIMGPDWAGFVADVTPVSHPAITRVLG